jgi:dephospho-CoA kinase
MRIGLTGGIGSGKSEVARILGELGAMIIDADELAREAVEPGSAGLAAIAAAWPPVVKNGALDRPGLAEIVFHDPAARERLNGIVHPIVRWLAAERESHAQPGQLIVHVIPLLYETGSNGMYEKTVVVLAPEDQRVARVTRRDDASEEHVRARMAAQIDPNDARRQADYVIENDGNLDALRERVQAFYKEVQ